MNIVNKVILSTLMSLTLIACTQAENKQNISKVNSVNEPHLATKKEVSMTKEQLPQTDENQQWRQATVTFLSHEGGFYGLIGENGVKLLPMNLAKEYRQHGAVVKFKGEMKAGMMTIQQWGTPFHITEIKLISAGKDSANHY